MLLKINEVADNRRPPEKRTICSVPSDTGVRFSEVAYPIPKEYFQFAVSRPIRYNLHNGYDKKNYCDCKADSL